MQPFTSQLIRQQLNTMIACWCLQYEYMDNRHVMRAFFKNIPNNLSIWEDGLNKLWGVWDISNSFLNIHFVLVYP